MYCSELSSSVIRKVQLHAVTQNLIYFITYIIYLYRNKENTRRAATVVNLLHQRVTFPRSFSLLEQILYDTKNVL